MNPSKVGSWPYPQISDDIQSKGFLGRNMVASLASYQCKDKYSLTLTHLTLMAEAGNIKHFSLPLMIQGWYL
jgi:hypothetical protein